MQFADLKGHCADTHQYFFQITLRDDSSAPLESVFLSKSISVATGESFETDAHLVQVESRVTEPKRSVSVHFAVSLNNRSLGDRSSRDASSALATPSGFLPSLPRPTCFNSRWPARCERAQWYLNWFAQVHGPSFLKTLKLWPFCPER